MLNFHITSACLPHYTPALYNWNNDSMKINKYQVPCDYPEFSLLTKIIKRNQSFQFPQDGRTCSYLCLFNATLWSQANPCVMAPLYKATDWRQVWRKPTAKEFKNCGEQIFQFPISPWNSESNISFCPSWNEKVSQSLSLRVILCRHMGYW